VKLDFNINNLEKLDCKGLTSPHKLELMSNCMTTRVRFFVPLLDVVPR